MIGTFALVFGHTHKPWMREYGRRRLRHCGSVGKSKDGDPRASFARLTDSRSGLEVAIERVVFEAEAVAAEIRAARLRKELAENLPRAA